MEKKYITLCVFLIGIHNFIVVTIKNFIKIKNLYLVTLYVVFRSIHQFHHSITWKQSINHLKEKKNVQAIFELKNLLENYFLKKIRNITPFVFEFRMHHIQMFTYKTCK